MTIKQPVMPINVINLIEAIKRNPNKNIDLIELEVNKARKGYKLELVIMYTNTNSHNEYENRTRLQDFEILEDAEAKQIRLAKQVNQHGEHKIETGRK